MIKQANTLSRKKTVRIPSIGGARFIAFIGPTCMVEPHNVSILHNYSAVLSKSGKGCHIHNIKWVELECDGSRDGHLVILAARLKKSSS